MTKLLPQPGCAYSFAYPRYNYEGLPGKIECRRVLVARVRDLRRQVLDPVTSTLNPLLRRGRHLVIGLDLDKGQERSFYLASMSNVERIDPDQQATATAEFIVVDGPRVAFRAKTLGEASAYVIGGHRGVICGVLSQAKVG